MAGYNFDPYGILSGLFQNLGGGSLFGGQSNLSQNGQNTAIGSFTNPGSASEQFSNNPSGGGMQLFYPMLSQLMGQIPGMGQSFSNNGQNYQVGNPYNTQQYGNTLQGANINPNTNFFTQGNNISGFANNGIFSALSNPLSISSLFNYGPGLGSPGSSPFQGFGFAPGVANPYQAQQQAQPTGSSAAVTSNAASPAAAAASVQTQPVGSSVGSPIGTGTAGPGDVGSIFGLGFAQNPWNYINQGGIFHS